MAKGDPDENKWAEAIGPVVSRLLNERSMDQKQLAKKLHMDPATTSRLVRGKHKITLDQLDWVAHALRVSRWSLLTRLGYLESDGRDTVDLDTLSPTARRLILALVREDLEATD